jgi:response regulator RpfG family c-di-GMP phosphodiesterase
MESPANPGAAPRRRVLIVDDEVANLETFRRVWRKHYEVTTASSGAAGLQLLGEHEFDVVLTDYGMPEMNGAAFVRAAVHRQTVALVVITGFVDKPEVRELEEEGHVFAVVGKPWDRATIVGIIEGASQHTSDLRRRAAT